MRHKMIIKVIKSTLSGFTGYHSLCILITTDGTGQRKRERDRERDRAGERQRKRLRKRVRERERKRVR
jgi:hypothetical protein